MTPGALAAALGRRVPRHPLLGPLRAMAEAAGTRLCVVGGYVRDVALGRRPGDVDLVCADDTRALRRAIAQRWHTAGFRFRKRGVTTWRFAIAGAGFDLVDASRRGLERDLRRRDLTINAMAYDLSARRLVDTCAGLADLRRGRLRLPRPGVIAEDPLRALRVARFLSELPGFRAVPSVLREARNARRGLTRVAPERVRQEFERLLAAPAPRRGLDCLDELELTDALLVELKPLRSCVAGPDRPDVWTHTLDAIQRSEDPRGLPGGAALRPAPERRILRWALLLHDMAKPSTLRHRPDGRPTFHGHEVRGARESDLLLRRLRVPRAERQRIRRLILLHLRPSLLAEEGSPPRGLRRLVRDAGADLPLLVLHAACDALGSGGAEDPARWSRLRRLLRRLLALQRDAARRPLPPLIDGKDVMRECGIDAGPLVGRILAAVRELQEEGRLTQRSQALRRLPALARRVRDCGAGAT